MFVPGQIIRRRDLHASFGGQEQGGISTPTSHPFIMLFTGKSGLSHGYEDGWTETGIFLYSGEGQLGDMSFVPGNRALRDHLKDGRDVYLFESIGPGLVQYVGQMTVSGYHERKGADSIGSERNAIVFELIPAQDPFQQGDSLDEPSSLDNAPDADIQRLLELPPTTIATPEERQTATLRRSRALRVFVLRRANGTCEGCGQAAPFETVAGTPYLELHYLRRPSDTGPEAAAWVAALCPNCHRRTHFGNDGDSYSRQIATKTGVLVE